MLPESKWLLTKMPDVDLAESQLPVVPVTAPSAHLQLPQESCRPSTVPLRNSRQRWLLAMLAGTPADRRLTALWQGRLSKSVSAASRQHDSCES